MSCCHLRDCVEAARRLKKQAAPLFPPAALAAMPLPLQQLRAADQSEGWLAPTLALSSFPANAGSSSSKAAALGSGARAIRDVVGVTAPERPDLDRPHFHLLRSASVARPNVLLLFAGLHAALEARVASIVSFVGHCLLPQRPRERCLVRLTGFHGAAPKSRSRQSARLRPVRLNCGNNMDCPSRTRSPRDLRSPVAAWQVRSARLVAHKGSRCSRPSSEIVIEASPSCAPDAHLHLPQKGDCQTLRRTLPWGWQDHFSIRHVGCSAIHFWPSIWP